MPHPECFNCMHEDVESPVGGPDDNNGVCLGCDNGNMYDDGTYGGSGNGRFVAG